MHCLSFTLSACATRQKSSQLTLPLTCEPPARAAAFLLSVDTAVTSYHCVRTAENIFVGGQPTSIKKLGKSIDLALLALSTPLSTPDPPALSFTPTLGDTYIVEAPARRQRPAQLVLYRVSFEVLQPSGGRIPLLELYDEKHRVRPGWSGAPVVSASGKVVGVVAQVFGNVVHAVPVRFLHRLQKNGDLPLSFVPGLEIQPLTSTAARRGAGVNDDISGVRVARVVEGLPLRVGDILTSVNGIPLSNKGTVDWGGLEATWQAAVCELSPGEHVSVSLLRDGGNTTEEVELRDAREATGAVSWMESRVVMAGAVVFAPLSFEFLHRWGEEWLREAPGDLVEIGMREKEQGVSEVVVLVGTVEGKGQGQGAWEEFENLRVVKVNGERVTCLEDLARDAGREAEMTVEFVNGFVAAIPVGEIVEMSSR